VRPCPEWGMNTLFPVATFERPISSHRWARTWVYLFHPGEEIHPGEESEEAGSYQRVSTLVPKSDGLRFSDPLLLMSTAFDESPSRRSGAHAESPSKNGHECYSKDPCAGGSDSPFSLACIDLSTLAGNFRHRLLSGNPDAQFSPVRAARRPTKVANSNTY
jgi:hypothetical protein